MGDGSWGEKIQSVFSGWRAIAIAAVVGVVVGGWGKTHLLEAADTASAAETLAAAAIDSTAENDAEIDSLRRSLQSLGSQLEELNKALRISFCTQPDQQPAARALLDCDSLSPPSQPGAGSR